MSAPASWTGRMLVVCRWCQPERHFGETPCPPEQDGEITHSICPECKAVALAELQGDMVEIAPEVVAQPGEGRAA